MKKVVAKKSLGQNFLKDEEIIEGIFDVAEVTPTDWVLEIGPGTGALTQHLVNRAEKVMAVELHHMLIEDLRLQFGEAKNITLVEGNILDINIQELLMTSQFAEHGYKIIANIPYYITAPIIRMLLSLKDQPVSMTLMVQDEVADRLSAKPGDMSMLSLMAQFYSTVEKKLLVPKEAFEPVPKVNSAVICIVPQRAYEPEEDKKLFRLARAGFSARRKTLSNNLSSSLGVSKEVVEAKLAELSLRNDIRAQALS
ncbi:MAG: 16S rRNA (adenine(1518)-N(6)/adenine(1519)-N(6))-dimethyltransferase RsmA, partial [Candidatus Moraniibacteriota bacterium]